MSRLKVLLANNCGTIFLTILLVNIIPNQAQRVKSVYGEPCDRLIRCDTRALLTCSAEGTCTCVGDGSLIFNETSRQCAVLAGEQCAITVGGGGLSWQVKAPCVTHAYCSSDGACVCSSAFFETSNGTCSPKLDLGGSCTNKDMCKNPLLCGEDNTCHCPGPVGPDGKSCIRHAGDSCSNSKECGPYAVCSYRCECKEGTFQNETRFCEPKRRFGGPCTRDYMCGSKCGPEGHCICSDEEVYDKTQLSCRLRPGSSCGKDKVGRKRCVKNSKCEDGKCKCHYGYFATSDGCQLKSNHGQQCTSTEMCQSQQYCSYGVCVCGNGRIYDEDEKGCLLGVGETCEIGGYSRSKQCGGHATCGWIGDRNYGKCKCKDDFIEKGYTCAVRGRHGSHCEGVRQCPSYRQEGGGSHYRAPLTHLVCETNSCVCNSTYAILRNPEKVERDNKYPCAFKVGAICEPDNVGECVDGAECLPAEGSWADDETRCRCTEGYLERGERCVRRLSLGESCQQNEECRDDEHLLCSRGICLCNETTTAFHPIQKSCVGKAGESCGNDGGCVPNSICSEGRCECENGTRASQGFCRVEEGHECDSDMETVHLGGNPVWRSCMKGLSCSNGTCQCLQSKLYDNVLERCACSEDKFEKDGSCEQKREHGEQCQEDEMCRSDFNLICGGNSTCVCEEGRVFIHSTETCAVAVGGTCGELDACGPNANCGDDQLCTCEVKYFATANGTCEPKRELGGGCEEDNHCVADGTLLVCVDGACGCDPMKSIYNNQSDEVPCVGKAGHRCAVGGERCVPNASCLPVLEIEVTNENSSTFEMICFCESGYYQTEAGICEPKLGYGKACQRSGTCREEDHLICEEDLCICHEGKVYDTNQERCVVKEGEFCLMENDCATNSECVEDVCRCKEGFFVTSTGTCELKQSFGGDCEQDNHCIQEMEWMNVNLSTFLVCDKGICGCNSNSSVYSNASDTTVTPCVQKAGANCFGGMYDCVEGAVCGEETCECENQYWESSDGFCLPKRGFGEDCLEGSCRDDVHLKCGAEGKCKCEETQEFHPDLEVCVGQAGELCVDSLCSVGSICRDGICTCDETIENASLGSGRCFAEEGQSCASDEAEFRSRCFEGLVCQGGSCGCPFPSYQIYDRLLRKCSGFAGSPCNVTEQCVDNADCVLEVTGSRSCQCREGFLQRNRGECDLPHGANCSDSRSRCDREGLLECGPELACRCSNPHQTRYDEVTLKCRGLIGAQCHVNEVDFCVEGASCKFIRGNDSDERFGICECDANHVELSDRSSCVTT